MSKDKNYEVERQARPEDNLANGYFELLRSVEYADDKKYSLTHLQALGHFWAEECTNPLRSERGQIEAKLITDRITFECAARLGRVTILSAFYKETTSA